MGYILPHKFFQAQYGEALRKLIADGRHLAEIVHFGDQQVFAGASTYTCLLFLDKGGNDRFQYTSANDLLGWRTARQGIEGKIAAAAANQPEWSFVVGPGAALFERLTGMYAKLGDIAARMAQGIRTSANEVYVLELISETGKLVRARSEALGRIVTLQRELAWPFLKGRDIKRYAITPSHQIVIIPYRVVRGRSQLIPLSELRQLSPKTYDYLAENRTHLENRESGRMKGPDWYGYVYPKNVEVMSSPKILVPDIARDASFALDEAGQYAFVSGYAITLTDSLRESGKYVLGLLNSKVLDFVLKQVSTSLRGGYFRYFSQFLGRLPIRTINFDDAEDVARHHKMVALVERMLDLHKKLHAATIPADKKLYQRQIEATDREIDRLVYELYGLTEEEIAIVEGREE